MDKSKLPPHILALAESMAGDVYRHAADQLRLMADAPQAAELSGPAALKAAADVFAMLANKH